jgi:hypothetical protein
MTLLMDNSHREADVLDNFNKLQIIGEKVGDGCVTVLEIKRGNRVTVLSEVEGKTVARL